MVQFHIAFSLTHQTVYAIMSVYVKSMNIAELLLSTIEEQKEKQGHKQYTIDTPNEGPYLYWIHIRYLTQYVSDTSFDMIKICSVF